MRFVNFIITYTETTVTNNMDPTIPSRIEARLRVDVQSDDVPPSVDVSRELFLAAINRHYERAYETQEEEEDDGEELEPYRVWYDYELYGDDDEDYGDDEEFYGDDEDEDEDEDVHVVGKFPVRSTT